MPQPSAPERRAPRAAVLALGVAALLAVAAPATAADWPTKPVRFVVPTPAGTGPDVDIRQMAGLFSGLLGQQVLVENKPGAGTRIAAESVIRSAPDGYTFLVGTPSLTTMSALYPQLKFDPKRELVPVCLASVTAYTLTVNAAVPARTVAEFVQLARSDPKYTAMGTLGVGSISHLTGAWFGSRHGVTPNFIHYSTTPPFPGLVGGQYPAIFEAMLPLMGHVQKGSLRTLAISGRKRHPLMPDVPTFAEAGVPDFEPLVWIGLFAPAGTPEPIVRRTADACAQVARNPDVVAARRNAGSESLGAGPQEFAAFLDAERAKWGAVIRTIGLTLE
ncbi:MAG TPA: tripartite tricarboxylate transporter substrate binding protein [Ramlibacter sp.]|nr:tripartite tricarboxylate transporter substrate binding protein [Ramlibacter sp.]